MSTWSAPGKLILCGEHVVVYGRPAIAVPMVQLRASASAAPQPAGAGLTLDAPDLCRCWQPTATPDDPLGMLALHTLKEVGANLPDTIITLRSQIPIASGLGSGAAIATALVRALSGLVGVELPPDRVSALVYESERFFHGTPSGIDNTVIAYEQPVWFVRSPDPTVTLLPSRTALHLLVADSGVRSQTWQPVGDLRRRYQEHPCQYEPLFDAVAATVHSIRAALESGQAAAIGPLLDINHELLVQLGVSSPELDRLVTAARAAGAWGAKMSGAGWGGVMLALVDHKQCNAVAAALRTAGATAVWPLQLGNLGG